MKTALLVGGTAASGIAIAAELRERGYHVTIYHRGEHEAPELGDLEHIHGDPHFRETIARDLGGRSWDLTVATYGRIRHLADVLRGRTGHFISVSGLPVLRSRIGVPFTEGDPYEDDERAPSGLRGLLGRIVETERAVLAAHQAGHFTATVVRYPYVYGPRGVAPLEWHVLRRALDGRKCWILQGAGLALTGRCAAPNAARLIALAADRPEISGGAIYHAADETQYSQREWIQLIADVLGHRFEFIDIPPSVVALDSPALPMSSEYSWVSQDEVEGGWIRHRMPLSIKAQRELGYRDAVSAADWMRLTSEYWLNNPPTVDGRAGRLSPSDFSYEAEDRLLAWWGRVLGDVPDFGRSMVRMHPYEHPKSPK